MTTLMLLTMMLGLVLAQGPTFLADQRCDRERVTFSTLREYRNKPTGCWDFAGNIIQFGQDSSIVFQSPINLRVATVYSVANGGYITYTQTPTQQGNETTISEEFAMLNRNTVPKRTCLDQVIQGQGIHTEVSSLSRFQFLEFMDQQTGYQAGYQILGFVPGSQGVEILQFHLLYSPEQGGGSRLILNALSGPRQPASACADFIPNYNAARFLDSEPDYTPVDLVA